MEFKKQFKEAYPETIGETDSHFDKSNYIDWIDKEYAQLKADKAELLELMEELHGMFSDNPDMMGEYAELYKNKTERIIQKMKQ